MTLRFCGVLLVLAAASAAAEKGKPEPRFQTSDRCIACHNELTTRNGTDVSIGFEWRASMMANSSRDPYWQAGVCGAKRSITRWRQPKSKTSARPAICRSRATWTVSPAGKGRVFAHLPFERDKRQGAEAADGVDCSVCHQISPQKLGTRESFNAGFVIETPSPSAPDQHVEYGPFAIEPGQQLIMRSSTKGFVPTENTRHIRQSEMCATCHTLYTTAVDANGKAAGSLPEQMPYQEWLHSDYRSKQTCQDCHMPEVPEPVSITRVFGVPRTGMKRHSFVAGNFFMVSMLNRFRNDLDVAALPEELSAAARRTVEFLQQQTARVTLENVETSGGRLTADVAIENLTGHKLPTAYPSRRSWIHFRVTDRAGRVVFESGALRPNGSIVGNDNDDDPQRWEPHYTEITRNDQVQVYEDIMLDTTGKVTTGLIAAVKYVKDNRLLPHGFDKHSADPDIAVVGEAAGAPDFREGGDRVRYSVDVAGAAGPLRVDAELWYEPIGYRWAHNLENYKSAFEPRRFLGYFESLADNAAQMLAHAQVTR